MAQSTRDVVGGLKYVAGPLQVREYVTDEVVYQNSLLRLSSAQKVRPWNGVSKFIGVAMHYAAAGEKVLVSIDPETLYEVTGYGPTILTDVGKYASLTLENINTRVGNYSTMRLAGVTNVYTLTTPLQIVGLQSAVSELPYAERLKAIVKLATGELEPYVDAN